MLISPDRIIALCPDAPLVSVAPIAHAFDENAQAYEITTLDRRAMLIAQVAVESGDFNHIEENLNYTHVEAIVHAFPHLAARAVSLVRNPPALANAAYADRDGNGDEASGDGWRYRGRGLIQLTGRANYAAASTAIGMNLVASPDLARSVVIAPRVAMWFWKERGCNPLADAGDVVAVTRLINGPAEEALQRRIDLFEKAKGIFI